MPMRGWKLRLDNKLKKKWRDKNMYMDIYGTYKLVQSFRIKDGLRFELEVKLMDGSTIYFNEEENGYISPYVTGFKGDKEIYLTGGFIDGNLYEPHRIKEYLRDNFPTIARAGGLFHEMCDSEY